MLGLSNSLIGGSPPEIFSPTDLNKLVAWWDFTDTNTMYSDAGVTKITHGDDIYRIDNKAYTILGGTAALGTFLQQSTSTYRPNWHSTSKAIFSTNDFLKGTTSVGNIAANQFSSSTVNGVAMTVFYVVGSLGSATGDEYLLNISGANPSDRMSIYLDNDSSNDRWQWHHQDNGDRTNTLMNCGVNATDDVELYTVHLDSTSASSFYRNGDTSDGVTNGSADDHTIDLSVDDSDVGVMVGVGTGSNNTSYLNGHVREILVYKRALTANELSKVENFLLSKHGIS